MRVNSFVVVALCAVVAGCQPATSDVEVEIIDTSLVGNIARQADTTLLLAAGPQRQLLGIVGGFEHRIGGGQKTITLWKDATGKILMMTEVENNRLVDSVAFYPNGQRIFKLQFNQQGKPDGAARYYYSDGRVREDGRFTSGVRTGVWRQFGEDGRLQMSREYDRYGQPSR
ncbi:MAG: hypothetical protein MUF62_02340 [Chitinophagaceae bacterium]|jgi:hypothetical protein|nr:hypothetical protein [Chitinophagaceae bacterium]